MSLEKYKPRQSATCIRKLRDIKYKLIISLAGSFNLPFIFKSFTFQIRISFERKKSFKERNFISIINSKALKFKLFKLFL